MWEWYNAHIIKDRGAAFISSTQNGTRMPCVKGTVAEIRLASSGTAGWLA